MNDTKYNNNIDINELKKLGASALEKLSHSIDEVSDKVAERTAELSEKTVSTIKKYPLHTALAAGAAFAFAGAVLAGAAFAATVDLLPIFAALMA